MATRAVPLHWRKYEERYQLLGTRCKKCGNVYFPLRKICPYCRRAGKPVPIRFSGKGKVHSFTVIRAPPDGFELFAPYIVGIIELDEGPKVISQIVDCGQDDVRIGMPVSACFRRLRTEGKDGIICYGFKFRPTDYSWKQNVGRNEKK